MYSVIYNELVFNVLEKRFGKNEAVVFARASAAGGQRFPVVSIIFICYDLTQCHLKHWGGDCESTYEAMAEAMRGALSLTLSGFGFASHDIGGFEVGLYYLVLLHLGSFSYRQHCPLGYSSSRRL